MKKLFAWILTATLLLTLTACGSTADDATKVTETTAKATEVDKIPATTPSENEVTIPSENEVTVPSENEVTVPSENEITAPSENEETESTEEVTTTNKPTSTTKKEEVTTKKPTSTTKKEEATTSKPTSTTKKPTTKPSSKPTTTTKPTTPNVYNNPNNFDIVKNDIRISVCYAEWRGNDLFIICYLTNGCDEPYYLKGQDYPTLSIYDKNNRLIASNDFEPLEPNDPNAFIPSGGKVKWEFTFTAALGEVELAGANLRDGLMIRVG